MDERMGLKRIDAYDFDADDIRLYAKHLDVREEDIVKALIDLAIGVAEMSRRDVSDVIKENIFGDPSDWEEEDECF
jgi:hypothetical protein